MKKNTSWKFMDESSVSGAGEFGLSPKIALNFKLLCENKATISGTFEYGITMKDV